MLKHHFTLTEALLDLCGFAALMAAGSQRKVTMTLFLFSTLLRFVHASKFLDRCYTVSTQRSPFLNGAM